jgi:hypothetical protein
VIFGEIIPQVRLIGTAKNTPYGLSADKTDLFALQSVCVRYGLRIGGACAPFVLAMMWFFGKAFNYFDLLQCININDIASQRLSHGQSPNSSTKFWEAMKVIHSGKRS